MEFFPYYLHFSSCSDKIHYRICPQKLVSCMEICIIRAILFLGIQMNLHPYFPHLSNVFEIPYKRPRYNAVKHLSFIKIGTGIAILFAWAQMKSHFCMCAMKTHDLHSKDHLGEFCILMNGVYHLHFRCLSSEHS
jgi:hypothetical protein